MGQSSKGFPSTMSPHKMMETNHNWRTTDLLDGFYTQGVVLLPHDVVIKKILARHARRLLNEFKSILAHGELAVSPIHHFHLGRNDLPHGLGTRFIPWLKPHVIS